MKKLLLCSLLLINFCTYSQSTIQWQKTIGGSGYDFGRNILPTSDGGYILATYSYSNDGDILNNHGGSDIIVMKLSSTGTIEWQKSYGGTGSDSANAIRKTSDGGYIIAGSSYSTDGDVTGNHGNNDCWIVKITSTGILEWQKSLGGSSTDEARVALQTSDGGYIMAGNTFSTDGNVTGNHSSNSDYWVVKLNSTGNIIWKKCYGSNSTDYLSSIVQTSDGGYILNGDIQANNGDVTGHHGDFDYWVIKISSTGVLEWQKALGGTGWDSGTSIIQDTDGNYVASGYSSSINGDITGTHGGGDAWVVKLDTTGNIIWQKALGGTNGDFLFYIQQSADGNYLLAGDTDSNNGDATGNHGSLDFWALKLSSSGDVLWHKCMGGSSEETAVSLIEGSDGSYMVSGYSSSADGDLTINHGQRDIWIVNLSNDLGIEENANNSLFSFYPNPTKDELHLNINPSIINHSYKIYDQLSKVIQTGILKTDSPTIQIGDLTTGIYFLDIMGTRKKIIKN